MPANDCQNNVLKLVWNGWHCLCIKQCRQANGFQTYELATKQQNLLGAGPASELQTTDSNSYAKKEDSTKFTNPQITHSVLAF